MPKQIGILACASPVKTGGHVTGNLAEKNPTRRAFRCGGSFLRSLEKCRVENDQETPLAAPFAWLLQKAPADLQLLCDGKKKENYRKGGNSYPKHSHLWNFHPPRGGTAELMKVSEKDCFSSELCLLKSKAAPKKCLTLLLGFGVHAWARKLCLPAFLLQCCMAPVQEVMWFCWPVQFKSLKHEKYCTSCLAMGKTSVWCKSWPWQKDLNAMLFGMKAASR